MDTNIVNDITDIYFGQIAISEALDPVGKEDDDLNNNGIPNDKSDKYLKKRRKAINKAISTQEAKEVKKWFDDDEDGIGYEEGEVSGKFKKKKKLKEGFSNWREDLVEVMDVISKEENDEQITDKKVVNNRERIKINPNIGEAVEELGGTLLEMTEIEDFEGVFDELSESDIFFLTDDLIEEVVEEVFEECLQEGYNVFEIENVLLESLEVSSALLNEAKVTYGHDTDVKSDRLEKVKSAVKKVGKGILRGAGYVAGAAVRGAKAVGRELGAGYKRGRYGSGGSSESDSSSDSSSSGGSSRVTQGRGSSRVTQGRGSSRPGLLGRIGSALKKGLKRILYKGAKAVERGAGSVARRTADNDGVRSASPRSGIGGGKKIEVTGSKESKVTQGKGKRRTVDQEEPVKKVSVKDVTVTPKKTEVRTGQPGSERKALPPAQSSDRRKKAAAKAADEAQGSTSSGVRIAGAGGVSPLATTKKAAETYSKPASGAPKRPAKKTKVTAATPATTKPVRKSTSKSTPKSREEELSQEADKILAQVRNEEISLSEMSISKDQQKLFGLALSVKRGETPRSEVSAEVLKIVDSMSEKKIRDFAKTSHEGLPQKVQTKEEAIREALLDRMLEKIENQQFFDEEQIDEFFGGGPKTVLPKGTQLSGSVKPVTPGTKYPAKLGGGDVDVTYNNQGGRTVSPRPKSSGTTQTPKPGIGARAATGLAASRERLNQFNQMNSYEPEGEMVDERRRVEKGTPRKPRNPAFELVAKSMGSNRLGVQPRRVKKVPGQKPPVAGEYGGPVSPQKKLEMRKTSKTEIGSRLD